MNVEWFALGLYAIWAIVAFGLRAVLQRRRTGDSGFRGLSGTHWSIEWWAGLLLAAGVILGVAAPIFALPGWVSPISLLWHPWVQLTGLAVGFCGVTATFAAQLSMGDSWRVGVDPKERTVLVTDGAFRLARNPIFTAMAVTAAGLAAAVPNVLSLVGFVGLIAGLQLQVRLVEEPYLLAVHGQEYAAYSARVGRFLPMIGRIKPSDTDVTPSDRS